MDPTLIVPSTPYATIWEMPGPKDIALMGFGVARSLHGRWRRLGAPARERLEPLAEDVRERGARPPRLGRSPRRTAGTWSEANRRLADAMIDEAAGDPEVSEIEVRDLRESLAPRARPLGRIFTGSVDFSRAAPSG